MADPWIVLAAALAEGLAGYPDRLHARVPHPVAWIGAAISGLERRWNRDDYSEGRRNVLGCLTLLIVASGAALAGLAVQEAAVWLRPWGAALVVVAGALGLAPRSLWDHVSAVHRALTAGDLAGARAAVGRIVGRDVQNLEAGDVAAAALESLAESLCDGVLAPLFWFLIAGLPGLFAYKAVNTADSLIGHMEPRWRSFGWASARTDDLANLMPARISGVLICLVAGRGWGTMTRDAPRHASPNAGWPEAAMAGALGVRLGGPAVYDGVTLDRPMFGDGREVESGDLSRGLGVYVRVLALVALGLLAGGLLWPH